jgi:hypothetical protein
VSDLQINDPLESIVGDALRADAMDAPELAEEWNDAPGMSTARTTRSTTRWVPALFGAAAAVLLVVALVVVAGQGNKNAPVAAPAWSPPGTEFASTDLGPASTVYQGPAVAALTRQIGIEGHPPQVISTSLIYDGGATATEQVCTSENGSAGCRPDWNTTPWSTSVTSSVDNGFASYDLWTIEGLPANTAFVSYVDGDLELWQRPIMSFAAFPNVPGEEQIVIAYSDNGTEIARFGAAQQAATAFTGPVPPQADLSTSEFADLSELTVTTLRVCLTTRGGTLDGDVATFPPEVDQAAVWEQCVTEAQQAVGDAVHELNPRFYDPATERPQNDDPARQTVVVTSEPTNNDAISVTVDFAHTDITLDADGWERTRFTPGEGALIGPEAEFTDPGGRSLQVNLYPGGAEGFIGRTQNEFPPEDIRTLDEFEQVATYPSGDRFRYNLLLDNGTILEIDGTGFDNAETFLTHVALVTTSRDE